MLKQASVRDLIADRVHRGARSYIVIAMRRYPRFINRQLRDEYQPSLASAPKLFEDWLSAKRRTGDHNGAFERVHFEERFELDDEGIENLKRLCGLSREKDVYLVCQCAQGLRCHREMLLLLAHKRFGAKIEEVKNAYPPNSSRTSVTYLTAVCEAYIFAMLASLMGGLPVATLRSQAPAASQASSQAALDSVSSWASWFCMAGKVIRALG